MARPTELTDQQKNPSRVGLSFFSDNEANESYPSTDNYSSDEYPGLYPGPDAPLPQKVPRKPAAFVPADSPTAYLNSLGPSTYSQSYGARQSPVPATRPQHVRKLSLQDSLAKPLPQPPQVTSPHTPLATPAEPLGHGIPRSVPGEAQYTRNTESRMDSRTSTMDSKSPAGGAGQPYSAQDAYLQDMAGSLSGSVGTITNSLLRPDGGEDARDGGQSRNGTASAGPSPAVAQGRTPVAGAPVGGTSQGQSTHLSGLMCNVHRTTGREPHPLVGATTTILGDKLYVFGGRILSRSRPAPLTSDLYELDLIRRHWTKLETTGDIPPPRYFHSVCPLGDTKMVCYGGMSPTPNQPVNGDQQPEVSVMSDIYIYDVPTNKWTYVPTQDAPQGRYAHCACILPSSAAFSSTKAPLSALQHNPSTGNPNEGRIGINIDGSGGAQMIIVGGQDSSNHYIEQISVFNLRSLKWTSTQPLGKSCGAYRSVAAPLPPSVAAKVGRIHQNGTHRTDGGISQEAREPGSSMLIYSNYNFLDVKLELQIRSSDGTLTERPMSGAYTPPGLRFPNGGVIDTHFVVSGTYLTSSKQEYALWALDLRTLTWSRIDAGGSVFNQGSWNRGVLWNRRNTFVILGNRKRSLVEDYNHRRINFSNVCMVELEAFGFYDNPRKTTPMSGFISASSPHSGPGLSLKRKAGYTAGGRFHSRASEELGEKALSMRELADMDILCIGGERIPVNSRIVGRRWGPYFVQLLREGTGTHDGDAMTLRPGMSSNPMRASTMTITPDNKHTADGSSFLSNSSVSTSGSSLAPPPSGAGSNYSGTTVAQGDDGNSTVVNAAPTPRSLPPNVRPRCLYLPHTSLTIQALLHFLYTSSLPAPTSPLCTPQILCSLLQISRPYRVDGLLEAVVERLHALLDSRNAAAVFNATAMAAGGGRGIDGSLNPNFFVGNIDPVGDPTDTSDFSMSSGTRNGSFSSQLTTRTGSLSINTSVGQSARPASDELSASTSVSGSEWDSEAGENEINQFIWKGELSSVIGLQKRGLRGLMEGRRMRERTGTGAMAPSTVASGGGSASAPYGGQQSGGPRVGLGIAGS